MNTHSAPHQRLLVGGLLLLLIGTAILTIGRPPTSHPRHARETEPRSHAASAPTIAPTTTLPSSTQPAAPPASARLTPAPTTAESLPSGLPLSGEGPAGDAAIQNALDRSSPTDLPPAVARHLTALATQVWIAETTGTGRSRWPDYFPDRHLRAPYRGVRVQAAIARRAEGQENRAVVSVVWQGTNSSGEAQDSRPGTVVFEDHRNEWKPVR